MATKEQLAESRKKAVLSSRIGKRGKNKKTIEKEKAREAYLFHMLDEGFFGKLTEVQRKAVLKAKNNKERQYVFDQLIGKSAETIKMDIEATLKIDV